MMKLTEKQKKLRKHKKELHSLRLKMGQNIVWFDSLSSRQKWNFLFLWKEEKWSNKLKSPKKVKRPGVKLVGGRIRRTMVDAIDYPPSLKHFIKRTKELPSFRVSRKNLRQSAIDILLNQK
jgi:hypothetical protein